MLIIHQTSRVLNVLRTKKLLFQILLRELFRWWSLERLQITLLHLILVNRLMVVVLVRWIIHKRRSLRKLWKASVVVKRLRFELTLVWVETSVHATAVIVLFPFSVFVLSFDVLRHFFELMKGLGDFLISFL